MTSRLDLMAEETSHVVTSSTEVGSSRSPATKPTSSELQHHASCIADPASPHFISACDAVAQAAVDSNLDDCPMLVSLFKAVASSSGAPQAYGSVILLLHPGQRKCKLTQRFIKSIMLTRGTSWPVKHTHWIATKHRLGCHAPVRRARRHATRLASAHLCALCYEALVHMLR